MLRAQCPERPHRLGASRWRALSVGRGGRGDLHNGPLPRWCAGFCTAVTLLGSVTCADGTERSVLLKSASDPESLFLFNYVFLRFY